MHFIFSTSTIKLILYMIIYMTGVNATHLLIIVKPQYLGEKHTIECTVKLLHCT